MKVKCGERSRICPARISPAHLLMLQMRQLMSRVEPGVGQGEAEGVMGLREWFRASSQPFSPQPLSRDRHHLQGPVEFEQNPEGGSRSVMTMLKRTDYKQGRAEGSRPCTPSS